MAELSMMETVQIDPDLLQERGSDTLFQRRIEFQLARRPFTGFESYRNDGCKLVTLNPNVETHKDTNSSDKAKCLETPVDPELSFEITFRRIGAGLRNLGNTCFLNSVLQCLTYTEPLAAYLQSGKHQSSCRKAGFCALCAIQKHISRALQATGRILEPKDLVSNLRCISRSFRNARQEDAHEYMRFLLESMHKCCLPAGVPCESEAAYERSLVYRIFGGSLRSQVKCMQCSFCSNKFDPFLDLSLEVVKADSVNKALAHYTAKEQLEGGAKQYQCQQCKQKVKALKQLTIHKAPHVLTIHLKRFDAHRTAQKINKNVYFGSTLDLKPFVTGPYDGDMNYTLYGVLVHAGWSTHSGHYYCFVRTSTGMWYSLDDNQVSLVNERTVLEQKAYMLFYVRDRKSFHTKKSVEIIKKESMLLNTIGSPVCLKSKKEEPKEKLGSVLVERKGDQVSPASVSDGSTVLSSAPKEILVEKDSVEKSIPVHGGPLTKNSSLLTTTSKSGVENSSSGVQSENGSAPPISEMPTSSQPEFLLTACGGNTKKGHCQNAKANYSMYGAGGSSLGSRIMFSFIRASRKKHHKKRKRHSPCNYTSPNDGLSVSGQSSDAVDFTPSPTIKNRGSGGEVQNSKSNLKSESVSKHCDDSQRPADQCLRESKQATAMGMLTRGLDFGFVPRWDGIGTSPAEKAQEPCGRPVQIGYIGDEWDEEYDRGKKKKIKSSSSRFGFSDSNPFQEIAKRRAKLLRRMQ